MSSALVPPTSGVKISFDSPKVPWHEAHLSSHTLRPCVTLPEPGGSPLKSGRTSMSHAAISAGVADRPTPGYGPANAAAAPANANAIPASGGTQARLIDLRIGHLPALG